MVLVVPLTRALGDKTTSKKDPLKNPVSNDALDIINGYVQIKQPISEQRNVTTARRPAASLHLCRCLSPAPQDDRARSDSGQQLNFISQHTVELMKQASGFISLI